MNTREFRCKINVVAFLSGNRANKIEMRVNVYKVCWNCSCYVQSFISCVCTHVWCSWMGNGREKMLAIFGAVSKWKRGNFRKLGHTHTHISIKLFLSDVNHMPYTQMLCTMDVGARSVMWACVCVWLCETMSAKNRISRRHCFFPHQRPHSLSLLGHALVRIVTYFCRLLHN